MVVDAHLGAQRNIVTDRQAAREPDLGREQAVPADGHIVADLDLIVDFGALADHRIPQAAAVDGGAGADLDIVLDQDAAGLGHLDVPLGAEENEAIAILADAAGGVDQDVVADQGELDRRAGADIAVPADLDVGADHRARADHRAGADLDPGADHHQRIDDDAVLQMGGRIDNGRRRDAVIVEPGLRAKRIGVPFARQLHEGAERLAGQHRHIGGHLGLEAQADQAGAGLGRLELIGVSEVVEKRQMHGTGLVERSEPDHLTTVRGRPIPLPSTRPARPASRKGLLEKYRLRHSTRRSPAGLHTRVPAPKKRSRPLLLFRGVLIADLTSVRQATLERCAAAKLELLHAVKLTLRKRNRIVEAQRTRRSPDDADTDRGAYHVAVVVLQSQTGSGRGPSRRRRAGSA